MEAALRVLNELVAAGIIGKYAIGGAVGAIYWVEPFDTVDLDIFVVLPSASLLEPLRDVFESLKARGYAFEGEFIVVEGIPVQFIPAEDPKGLRHAALENAIPIRYQGDSGDVQTWVLSPEYLIALALDVHRSKDYDRVSRLLTEAKPDREVVQQLITTFELTSSWEVFLRRYPEFTNS